ncbi:hypothetical protein [Rhodococcus gannanensis]|uniref:Uncharacterized protein n=1 Tax=Rhodococcus gannanensis TaxID=1960308 RepID=A0ABW4NWW8_9NOCA
MAFGFITDPPAEDDGNGSSTADIITILTLLQSLTIGITSGQG